MILEQMKSSDRKLWVDDVRNPPDGSYAVARTYDDAIDYLTRVSYDEVFLDHDLGDFKDGKERTGYDIVMWLVQQKMDGHKVPIKYTLLTANPVGRDRMQGVIDRYLS